MRISWLTAHEIAAAREALVAHDATWDSHFELAFVPPAMPEGAAIADWVGVVEHVARAERVSQVVRDHGLAAARARFAGTHSAIEAATLAAAAHEGDELDLDQIVGVLRCPIDPYVFYAPFVEMMIVRGKTELDRTVEAYEDFAAAYAQTMSQIPFSADRIGAVRDGLADFYVSAGRLDEAESLFERRHDEDQGDVAVALSASRAFLAAGSVSHAVRWLGVGAAP